MDEPYNRDDIYERALSMDMVLISVLRLKHTHSFRVLDAN